MVLHPEMRSPLGHALVTIGDRIILFVLLVIILCRFEGALGGIFITTLGYLTFRHGSGLSYNVLLSVVVVLFFALLIEHEVERKQYGTVEYGVPGGVASEGTTRKNNMRKAREATCDGRLER
jgi:hypothetical protein